MRTQERLLRLLVAVTGRDTERLSLRQHSPLLWARRLGQAGLDAARLGTELPVQLRRLLGELERGNLELGMRPEGFDRVLRRIERLGNRLALAIMTTGFVIGLAVLMATYHPSGWEQWGGVLFTVGFVLAGALGTYLAWSILRSGRG